MHVTLPISDDQPLMRYMTHDKFLRLLDPQPAFDAWAFLDKPVDRTLIRKRHAAYGSLWMALPHVFKDKDEGTFPALNADDEAYCDCIARHLGSSSDEAERKKREFVAKNPADFRAAVRARSQLIGVSCWYQDSVESDVMWKEYVPDGRGVAIKTTIGQFNEAIGYVSPQAYSKRARPEWHC